jgi:hypothetical protein
VDKKDAAEMVGDALREAGILIMPNSLHSLTTLMRREQRIPADTLADFHHQRFPWLCFRPKYLTYEPRHRLH